MFDPLVASGADQPFDIGLHRQLKSSLRNRVEQIVLLRGWLE
jgi:hypothetical protein